MAGARRTDLLGKLADFGEEAIQRLSDAPGGDRLLGALNATRERVDELQKRVRGLEDLERRLVALERKVEKLAKGATTSGTSSRSSSKTTTTKSSGGSRAKKS
jgi:MoxR-like ATPase